MLGQWTGHLHPAPAGRCAVAARCLCWQPWCLACSGGVDLVNNRFPLALELFIPTVTFSDVEVQSTCVEDRCWQWSTVRLILNSQSTSLQPERVDIRLAGVAGASLSATSIEVQPGSARIELEIQPKPPSNLGNMRGKLELEAQACWRPVLPVEPLPAGSQVDVFFKSCSKPLIIFGISLLVLAIIIMQWW